MTSHGDFGFGGIEKCPACGSDQLSVVYDQGRADFLCEECEQCWHLSMGWAQRVDPLTCDTGAERGRCLAASDTIDLRIDSTVPA